MPSYLVETYLARPRRRRARRTRAAGASVAAELTGREPASALTAHPFPEDEICFFVFDAPSGTDAALAAQRAGLDPLRVVEAISSEEGEK